MTYNTYLVRTAALAVDHPPYALVDRVLVRARDAKEAKERALAELAQRNSEYLVACLVEGSDPAAGLQVLEWRLEVPEAAATTVADVLDSTQGGSLDLRLAFRAQKLQRQNTLLQRRCALLVGLAILFGIMAVTAVHLLNERTAELIRIEGQAKNGH